MPSAINQTTTSVIKYMTTSKQMGAKIGHEIIPQNDSLLKLFSTYKLPVLLNFSIEK
jgi:hypothetical protein